MAIIIDTNCFANVFSRKSEKHEDFKPVLDWILYGKGFMIYGGDKYKEELKKAPKYLKLINLLKNVGKVHIGNDQKINAKQAEIDKDNTDKLFNDTHILSICLETKCILICSEDTTSIPFITNPKYFKRGETKPAFYTSSRNKSILCDNYVNDIHKPLCKINRALAEKIESTL